MSVTVPASVRRSDPDRRDRIIDACLDVIAREGVAGTSHRRVAAEADVPLGSMTYHFAGMDELLTEAFSRYVDRSANDAEAGLDQASTIADAEAAVVDLIRFGATSSPRDLAITHELYTLAARQPRFRVITDRWLARSRRTLGKHFDGATVVILDALIEGLTLHQALTGRTDDEIARDAVHRIVTGSARP